MPLAALLDTNVWVSAFLKPNGPPGQVVAAWADDEFSIVTSLSQLSEIDRSSQQTATGSTVSVSPAGRRDICSIDRGSGDSRADIGRTANIRDPDDDQIVEAAIGGKAQYLVTRDDDLKRDLDLIKMARRNRVRVVSVRQFLRRLARQAKR